MNKLQAIMDQAYLKFTDLSYAQFIDTLTLKEKVAVLCGNLNYQWENGGLTQWVDNGYVSHYRDLMSILKEINTEVSKKVIDLLVELSNDVKNDALNGIETNDPWCADYYSHNGNNGYCVPDLGHLNDEFYKINDQFLTDVETFIEATFK